jgi:uncharacterized membrane protein YdjX (TVP38/TMEM64 family)
VNRSAHKNVVWRRAAIVLLAVSLLGVVVSLPDVHESLADVMRAMERLIAGHPAVGAVVFVLFAALAAIFAFVSAGVLAPAAVLVWGSAATVLLLWVGWIAGGAATYAIGKYAGRATAKWLTGGKNLRRFEQVIERNASIWRIFLLQLALPSEIPGYLLGAARYPFWRYLLALAAAELPYAVATAYVASSFMEQNAAAITIVGIAIALVGVGAFYVLHRKRSNRVRV